MHYDPAKENILYFISKIHLQMDRYNLCLCLP